MLIQENTIVIEDVQLNIHMEKGKYKNLSISIQPGNIICIHAPIAMKDERIWKFVQQKEFWIYKQAMKYQTDEELANGQDELRNLPEAIKKQKAIEIVKPLLHQYCEVMNTSYDILRITNAKSYWGCCNKGKRSVSFVWQIILLPIEIVEYLVVHELSHMYEANHSKKFWGIVESYMPDYKKKEKWLKENGWKYH